IQKRHDDEISQRVALEIKWRKAEEKAERLEQEVLELRALVHQLEGVLAENKEKDGKLEAALAKIDKLREHSRVVGHYLIQTGLKAEESDEVKKEELLRCLSGILQ
ncbi:hypothetical protein H0H92_001588, partial [Tricholoma furcatifolium]